MHAVIVIPARLASTRLPKKLLLSETGKTLIQHTYEAAAQSHLASDVIIAADDEELVRAIEAFGGNVQLTAADHTCGTDRVAEIAAKLDCEIIINVQGDEPEIDATAIDALISVFENPDAKCATLAAPIRRQDVLESPSNVKVVFDRHQRAMYFSRSVIPFPRLGVEQALQIEPPVFWQHVGLYGYRREFLLEIAQCPAVPIETTESLEQLRILDAGESIFIRTISAAKPGIDTLDDYNAFVSRQGS
ncbi:MAG: 3-deoxy-manno-octulosonate cytidylyltransferase [Planctomycetota bacterium]